MPDAAQGLYRFRGFRRRRLRQELFRPVASAASWSWLARRAGENHWPDPIHSSWGSTRANRPATRSGRAGAGGVSGGSLRRLRQASRWCSVISVLSFPVVVRRVAGQVLLGSAGPAATL